MNWIQNMTKNTVKNKLNIKQKSVNNYTLHLSSSHQFTLMSSYKSLYTNKSLSSVYKSLYATTTDIFRMKKYNEKFEKEVKNKENKENVIKLFSMIDILTKSWHSKRQWKSFLKYVEFKFNLQTIVLLTVHDVFLDVTNSMKN